MTFHVWVGDAARILYCPSDLGLSQLSKLVKFMLWNGFSRGKRSSSSYPFKSFWFLHFFPHKNSNEIVESYGNMFWDGKLAFAPCFIHGGIREVRLQRNLVRSKVFGAKASTLSHGKHRTRITPSVIACSCKWWLLHIHDLGWMSELTGYGLPECFSRGIQCRRDGREKK